MIGIPSFDCLYCERLCPRCRYPISGGWEHVESTHIRGTFAEGQPIVACDLVRVVRPLVENLDAYFTHKRDHEWRFVPPIGAAEDELAVPRAEVPR